MKQYNYFVAIQQDIEDFMHDEHLSTNYYDSLDDFLEKMNDILWSNDNITGNGGAYYDTEENCEEFLCHNLELVFESCHEFGVTITKLRQEKQKGTCARYVDCIVRCYLLDSILVKIWEEQGEDENDEDFSEE